MVQQPARADNSAVVYEARNRVNGHRYIGFTSQGLVRREWQHRQSVKTKVGSTKLKAALAEFGGENFVFSVLVDFAGDEELALAYEAEAIEKYRPEYNLRGGGQSGGSIAAETRRKMSEVQKGRPSTLKGVPISAAHRQAIIDGKAKRDNRHSEETRARIRTAVADRVFSDAERAAARGRIAVYGKLVLVKVKCLDDDMVFESCTAADKYYGFRMATVSNAIGRKGVTFGKRFVRVAESVG